jgi:hypothetical protein
MDKQHEQRLMILFEHPEAFPLPRRVSGTNANERRADCCGFTANLRRTVGLLYCHHMCHGRPTTQSIIQGACCG